MYLILWGITRSCSLNQGSWDDIRQASAYTRFRPWGGRARRKSSVRLRPATPGLNLKEYNNCILQCGTKWRADMWLTSLIFISSRAPHSIFQKFNFGFFQFFLLFLFFFSEELKIKKTRTEWILELHFSFFRGIWISQSACVILSFQKSVWSFLEN